MPSATPLPRYRLRRSAFGATGRRNSWILACTRSIAMPALRRTSTSAAPGHSQRTHHRRCQHRRVTEDRGERYQMQRRHGVRHSRGDPAAAQRPATRHRVVTVNPVRDRQAEVADRRGFQRGALHPGHDDRGLACRGYPRPSTVPLSARANRSGSAGRSRGDHQAAKPASLVAVAACRQAARYTPHCRITDGHLREAGRRLVDGGHARTGDAARRRQHVVSVPSGYRRRLPLPTAGRQRRPRIPGQRLPP